MSATTRATSRAARAATAERFGWDLPSVEVHFEHALVVDEWVSEEVCEPDP